MIKINKNLLIFLSLAVGLGISVLAVITKFIPLFINHTVYYCQRLGSFFSMEFPHQISLAVIGFFTIVFIVTVIRLIWLFVEVHLLKRKLIRYSRKKIPLSNLIKRHNLQNKVYLIENEQIFAFCFGILHPKIYISTHLLSLMSENEIEAVLLHEKYHLDNRDSLIMLIATVVQHLFPFFPLLSDLVRNYKIEREIEADHQVVQTLASAQPVTAVLKKLLCIPTLTLPTAVALAEHETLRPRIKAIIGEKYSYIRFSKAKMFISFFAFVVIISMLVVPVHAMEVHNHKQDVMMVCLQSGGCITACTDKNAITPYTVPYSSDNASHPYSVAK